MVVKLTIILSNDKHVHVLDEVSKEMGEEILKKQYQEAFNLLTSVSEDPSEKAIVEKCELVKEV